MIHLGMISAMYEAKASGRDKYNFFTADLNEIMQHETKLMADMKVGLRRHEFELYYQPKTECKSGRIVACEALIRWNHPELGLVPPDKFIPLAEKNNFKDKSSLNILSYIHQCGLSISLGCDLYQGYLCSKPLPADAFAQLIQDINGE